MDDYAEISVGNNIHFYVNDGGQMGFKVKNEEGVVLTAISLGLSNKYNLDHITYQMNQLRHKLNR